MSRVSEMSLEEILKETDIIMRSTDIDFIYDEKTEREIAKEFKEKFKNGVDKREEVKKFLIDAEKRIPLEKRVEKREKLLLLIIINYRENIKTLKRYIERFKKESLTNKSPELISNLSKYYIQLYQQEENLEQALKIGKGMTQTLTYYYYDDKEKRYKVDVVDSREIIDGKKPDNSKNLRRFDNIDKSFRNEEYSEEIGLEYVIQSLLLTDLSAIFDNKKLKNTVNLGDNIRAMILENIALEKGIITRKEIDELNTSEERHAEFIDSVPYDLDVLPNVKATLREYIQYLDIDNLLLISAYRFNEFLESNGC